MKALQRVEAVIVAYEANNLPRIGGAVTVADLRAVVAMAKRAQELERATRRRKPRPENSDFPTYPNPFPHSVLVEWIHGQGWVPVTPRTNLPSPSTVKGARNRGANSKRRGK